ncbi:MAG: hypothetical protein KA764_06600 [Anaerolineales bacterium]|nr:hypothetical protein [Anaerolineales bacterium]
MRRLASSLLAVVVSVGLAWPASQTAAASPAPANYWLYLPTVTREASGAALLGQAVNQLTLNDFTAAVTNGVAGEVRGVYVASVLALPVVQQPAGDFGFVSSQPETVTQFGLAAQYGAVGLLAHNYAAGQKFFDLQLQEPVVVVYGDGQLRTYRITAILRYQALEPASPTSRFVDLETGGELSAGAVFGRAYANAGQVTFQTCIAANGQGSWGRLFVIAEPVN